MQLNITTDYSIRIILYLAIKKTIVSSREISTVMGITKSYVLKISRTLSEHGLIKKTVGADGGLELNKPSSEITLFEIIDIMEPTTKINRCLEEDRYCSRFATEDCPVRNVYVGMQNTWERMLKEVTVEQILENAK